MPEQMCDGGPYCQATPHIHGCFADKGGDCDHPSEHSTLFERWLTLKLRRWADARERRNPFGHGKTGTALLRAAADRIEELERQLAEADRG